MDSSSTRPLPSGFLLIWFGQVVPCVSVLLLFCSWKIFYCTGVPQWVDTFIYWVVPIYFSYHELCCYKHLWISFCASSTLQARSPFKWVKHHYRCHTRPNSLLSSMFWVKHTVKDVCCHWMLLYATLNTGHVTQDKAFRPSSVCLCPLRLLCSTLVCHTSHGLTHTLADVTGHTSAFSLPPPTESTCFTLIPTGVFFTYSQGPASPVRTLTCQEQLGVLQYCLLSPGFLCVFESLNSNP